MCAGLQQRVRHNRLRQKAADVVRAAQERCVAEKRGPGGERAWHTHNQITHAELSEGFHEVAAARGASCPMNVRVFEEGPILSLVAGDQNVGG